MLYGNFGSYSEPVTLVTQCCKYWELFATSCLSYAVSELLGAIYNCLDSSRKSCYALLARVASFCEDFMEYELSAMHVFRCQVCMFHK